MSRAAFVRRGLMAAGCVGVVRQRGDRPGSMRAGGARTRGGGGLAVATAAVRMLYAGGQFCRSLTHRDADSAWGEKAFANPGRARQFTVFATLLVIEASSLARHLGGRAPPRTPKTAGHDEDRHGGWMLVSALPGRRACARAVYALVAGLMEPSASHAGESRRWC